MTASYSIPGVGYTAHNPNNDNGTIAPTAALSSMPYTPNESIAALKHFYRTYGSDLWGDFGFKDAFNLTYSSKGVSGQWFSDGYLAIDQGPIIVMIENHRSGLLWNNFMANPEIPAMLDSIGFVSDSTTSVDDENFIIKEFKLEQNYPNPFNPETVISWQLTIGSNVTLKIFNSLGEEIETVVDEYLEAGEHSSRYLVSSSLPSGIYFYRLQADTFVDTKKMVLVR